MKIKLVPQDCWIGLYWKTNSGAEGFSYKHYTTTWYLCLIPCLPFIWKTTKRTIKQF